MAKYENFVAIMVGLTLLFYFTGLLGETPNNTLLDLLLDPQGFQNSNLGIKILAIFSGAAASTIAIGFFSSINTKTVAVSVFIIFFTTLLWDFLSVVDKVYDSNPVIAILFFSPLLILYLIGAINWWGTVSS